MAETVSDRIIKRREEFGITQQELAKRAGYAGKSSISKIESSGNDITLKKIERMAKALSCSPSYLMGWSDESGREKTTNNDNVIDQQFDFVSDCSIKLMKLIDHLNQEGQNKLLDYADDLVQSNKYRR